MLIDFHTHAFPDKIAERAITSLENSLLEFTGDESRSRANYRGTLNGLRDSMKKNGVDISVVLPIATTVTQSESINSFASKINGKCGIISFGSLHPMQENVEKELVRIKELGLKGIKLHPEYQGFYINSPESLKILKKAEELGLFVVLHTGKDLGMPEPIHCPPQLLRDALNHVSGKNIIAAHMGGYLLWDDVLKYLVGTDIMFDTSYCLGEMPKDIAKEIKPIKGIKEVTTGFENPSPETRIIVDKNKAMEYGLTIAQIYQTIANEIKTDTSSTILTVGRNDYPVIVSSGDSLTKNELKDLTITGTKDN